MLEFQPGVDIQIIKASLFNLSELDRVLGSAFLCRRQSILGLLDEPTDQRCSTTDNPCDNCRQSINPVFRPVLNQFNAVMEILQTSSVDLQMLREYLAGISCGGSIENTKWHSFLQAWPLEEIAQFTDFLLSNGFIHKHGIILNNSPVCFLQPSQKGLELLASGTEILFPVNQSPVINVFSKKISWRTNRTRTHDLKNRRFFPKQQKRSS